MNGSSCRNRNVFEKKAVDFEDAAEVSGRQYVRDHTGVLPVVCERVSFGFIVVAPEVLLSENSDVLSILTTRKQNHQDMQAAKPNPFDLKRTSGWLPLGIGLLLSIPSARADEPTEESDDLPVIRGNL